MGTVHRSHPTLYRASDLRPGWRVLHYRTASPVASVETWSNLEDCNPDTVTNDEDLTLEAQDSDGNPTQVVVHRAKSSPEDHEHSHRFVTVTFQDGSSDSWHPDDHVHAAPAKEA